MKHSYHELLEAAGHRLIRGTDGSVDIFVLDAEPHNGPGCEICGKSWCHHCELDIERCQGVPTALRDGSRSPTIQQLLDGLRTLAVYGHDTSETVELYGGVLFAGECRDPRSELLDRMASSGWEYDGDMESFRINLHMR